MASLTIDGKNRWIKDGEYVLGYQATRLDKVEKEQYNPRVGGTRIVDVSKLVLMNRNGEQLELTLGMPVYVANYTAKLYDKEYNATWSVREGTRLSGRQVKSITKEQVVFVNEQGEELAVSAE
jgi:hypothetical protein